jgi:hypothetical protein
MMRKIHSAKMNGVTSIRLAANFDAAIPRHRQKLYPPTACYRAFPKYLPLLDGYRHSRQTQKAEAAANSACGQHQQETQIRSAAESTAESVKEKP